LRLLLRLRLLLWLLWWLWWLWWLWLLWLLWLLRLLLDNDHVFGMVFDVPSDGLPVGR
jgi:hypothetical protein